MFTLFGGGAKQDESPKRKLYLRSGNEIIVEDPNSLDAKGAEIRYNLNELLTDINPKELLIALPTALVASLHANTHLIDDEIRQRAENCDLTAVTYVASLVDNCVTPARVTKKVSNSHAKKVADNTVDLADDDSSITSTGTSPEHKKAKGKGGRAESRGRAGSRGRTGSQDSGDFPDIHRNDKFNQRKGKNEADAEVVRNTTTIQCEPGIERFRNHSAYSKVEQAEFNSDSYNRWSAITKQILGHQLTNTHNNEDTEVGYLKEEVEAVLRKKSHSKYGIAAYLIASYATVHNNRHNGFSYSAERILRTVVIYYQNAASGKSDNALKVAPKLSVVGGSQMAGGMDYIPLHE